MSRCTLSNQSFLSRVCLASGFVLKESLTFDGRSEDLTMMMGLHSAWAAAECNLAVISGRSYYHFVKLYLTKSSFSPHAPACSPEVPPRLALLFL